MHMSPAAKYISAAQVGISLNGLQEWLSKVRYVHALPGSSNIHVALDRERIVCANVPVRPKSALTFTPTIKFRLRFGGAIEELAIESIVEILADFSPMTVRGKSALLSSSSDHGKIALAILRVFGDDINDAIHRVGAPQRAAWTANHLDPVNVLEQDILNIP